jgi:fatty-acyl-CoA synthase
VKRALELNREAGYAAPLVIDVDDPVYDGLGERIGSQEYEAWIGAGDPNQSYRLPEDEWDAIGLNYTSGTTGNPKGVVVHHRGAYLNATGNVLSWSLPRHPVYLWTLPMFHCNGWCFPWTLAAVAGTNVCLRKVEAKAIFDAIRTHKVTHFCGAPIVHSLLVSAPAPMQAGIAHEVRCMVAGAAPPASMIAGMEKLGFKLTHVYGLTEVYGPASVCVQQASWDLLSIDERAELNGRQGVRYQVQQGLTVLDSVTMQALPRDGQTMGEVMFRGNIVMKGYLKNEQATSEAFAGGWFHTGDLGVLQADGYVKLKDRAKDIIISGGENISSIEVEDVLYKHPAVLACAVIAKPDAKWGETPLAIVELRPDAKVSADELVAHCRTHLAGFKCPREVRFEELPKTSTGKIQKHLLRAKIGSAAAIQAAT